MNTPGIYFLSIILNQKQKNTKIFNHKLTIIKLEIVNL